MTRRARAGVAAALVALLVGCGLPVEEGVRLPEAAADGRLVGAEQGSPGTVTLPLGPQPGEPPPDVVSGFLQAQSSPEDDHAIARRFLAPEARGIWNDDAEVQVYDPLSLTFELVGDAAASDVVQVRLRGTVTASISDDGSLDPTDRELDESYALRRDAAGNWLLTQVPAGLRLNPEEVDRFYATQPVYYLATGTGPQGHLVPDPALLLLEKDPAATLLQRLLKGPSASLEGAVTTAVPEGAELRSVTTDAAGLVTVDLGAAVGRLSPRQLQRLSAQLVWTLRGAGPAFAKLRLLADGRPVEVPGVDDDVQDRSDWDDYDPDGLPEQVTTYYIAERRLRTLETDRPVAAVAGLTADDAAVSPRTDQLALLTDVGEGRWEVRVGPLSGPLPGTPTYVGGGLRSPSWGAGTRGLWLLQTGPGPQVLLLDGTGRARPVPVVDPPPGRLTALRVSRDGARVALVSGVDDASRKVYVAPVLDDDDGLRIGRPREVGFGVTDVSDVAWESPTSIVALGRFDDLPPLPLKLTIDGSGDVDLVRLPGLEQVTPESLAAGPDRPLVVAVKDREGRSVLFRSTGLVFEQAPVSGYAPLYPG